MTIALAVLVVAIVVGASSLVLGREIRARRRDAAIQWLIATFGPARALARTDPRAVLVWHPLAKTSRGLFPDAFRAVEAAGGSPFPFSREDLEAAHARWTADWLAWERAHDAEYKLKAAGIEEAMARRGEPASPVDRAGLEAVQREQLERYQQRYEEYIRTARVLAALNQESS